MSYNTGFGSANEVLGGSRFVELTAGAPSRAFHEVDTMPLRMPDLLPNPVRPWFESPPVMAALAPVMTPVRIAPTLRIPYPAINLEPFYVRPDLPKLIAKVGRYGDDF